MADKEIMRDPKITELLKNIDSEMNEVTKYAPKQVREVLNVVPSEGLLGGMEATAQGILAALEEVNTKRDALQASAEHGIARMKEWMTVFATQHAQLMQEMNDLQGRINESVERIVDIGKPRVNGGGDDHR